MKQYKLVVQSPHVQEVWIQAEKIRFVLSIHSTVISSQKPASAAQHWQNLNSSSWGKKVKFSLLNSMLSPQSPRHWVTLMLLSLRTHCSLFLIKTSWRGIGHTSHFSCGSKENKTTNNRRQHNNYRYLKH